MLLGLQSVAEDHKAIAQKQLELQESAIKHVLSKKQEECLQLFRLTTGTNSAAYEWYKDNVETRVEGTCQWLLKHQNFQRWLAQDSGPLLVSADPGCGKSVLSRYIIDDILPRSSTICYFFFKDQDQNTVRQALCALLHQLFSQKPYLIKYAMEDFAKNGQSLIYLQGSLWSVFEKAIRDPLAGSVIIVLDALDECAGTELRDLMQYLKRSISSIQSDHRELKFFLTSRPYEQITDKFRDLQNAFSFIRIPGEEYSESIRQEISHVIQYRVKQLSDEKGLSAALEAHLALQLSKVEHRTYLWVYLVFKSLQTESFKKTTRGINYIFESLPKSVFEAYERILDKSENHPIVRQALSIIFAARRPLTLSEMNVALSIDDKTKSNHELDLEEEEDFRSRLRTWCGLFISIYEDRIYFLHQTAREFLSARAPLPAGILSESIWQHSIVSQNAHRILAETCVLYLDLLNNRASPLSTAEGSDLQVHSFLDYSAKEWGSHYLEAHIGADADITPATLRICRPDSRAWSAWFKVFWKFTRFPSTDNFTSIMIASYFGLEGMTIALLEQGADFDAKETGRGLAPLSWATIKGHDTIVKLLLQKGADLETKDHYGRTPLIYAVRFGHMDIVNLLLKKGADFEVKNYTDKAPVSYAIPCGHKATTINSILAQGPEFDVSDNCGRTLLSYVAQNGHDAVVKLLLAEGADFEVDDCCGRTPLSYAVENGHHTVMNLLLEKGADSEGKDFGGRTPLSYAAENGHDAVVNLLLEKGADFEMSDYRGRTLLSYAAENGHDAVVNLLLEKGADFDRRNNGGQLPDAWAMRNGEEPFVSLLFEKAKHKRTKDNSWIPLSYFMICGVIAVMNILLEKCMGFRIMENSGRTPLSYAAENGHHTVMNLLLKKGAEYKLKDNSGRTPLSYAAENRHHTVMDLLLVRDVTGFEARDNKGQEPL
jgi:ankyrin repeat protein